MTGPDGEEARDPRRRLRRTAAWVATIASVLAGLVLLAAVTAVSDCSFAGGRCPESDPTFDGGPFVLGMIAGLLIAAPPLLLARRRTFTVAGVALAVSLVLAYGAAMS